MLLTKTKDKILTLEDFKKDFKDRNLDIENDVVYFWTESYPNKYLSNRFKSKIIINKDEFSSLGDYYNLQRKKYNKEDWKEVKEAILIEGLFEKFKQDKISSIWLELTKDKYLVQASHLDDEYSINFHMNTAKKIGVDKWKGKNLLGFYLMYVRNNMESNFEE